MKTWRLTASVLIAFVAHQGAAIAAPCPADPAQRLRPCDLEVVGGEETWRADDVFALRWRNPPAGGGPSVAAVHYRVLDSSLQVVRERSIGQAAETAEPVVVPPAPGIYTAEVWLEDASGEIGPPSSVKLRFDNARPGHVEPLPAPEWIGSADFPFPLRLGHPAGPEPISGIRGYAVAVDRETDSDPCAATNRCSEAETSLRGGPQDDTLWLATLPEGTSYAHAVAVSGSGMKSASVGRTLLRVDTTEPVTTLTGAPEGWTNRPVTLVATASDATSGMAPAGGPADPLTAIRLDGGAPVVAAGDSVRARAIAPGVHTVTSYARDAAGNLGEGSEANGGPGAASATAVVRIDPDPPRVRFSGSQAPDDPETIEAAVSDSLSGPSLKRGQIAVRRAGSGDRFEPLPTGVEAGRLRARWDSESYPPGLYEFRATGFDRAGNAEGTLSRASGSPMLLSAPLKRPTELHLRLDRAAKLVGRLTGGRRTPLAGMTVRVVERFDPGATPEERVSVVRTGPDGGFALPVSSGPSREIAASFAGTATLSRSRSDSLRLGVPGVVRMRASSRVATVGGSPVVFSGRVVGEIPPRGKYVQLQFRLPELEWTEFRTIRTDARGRFRHAYRFSDDDSRGVRFRFRAYAVAQDDWPYEPAGSRPVAVRGR